MRDPFAGDTVYGGTCPALIFHDYIAAALQGQPEADLPDAPSDGAAPAGVRSGAR